VRLPSGESARIASRARIFAPVIAVSPMSSQTAEKDPYNLNLSLLSEIFRIAPPDDDNKLYSENLSDKVHSRKFND